MGLSKWWCPKYNQTGLQKLPRAHAACQLLQIQSHQRGAAPDADPAVQVEVDGHNIHNFYSDDSEMSSAKPSTPDIVSHRPITPSSTWDNASFSTQRDDISSTASYDRGASSDADISDAPASTIPGQEPKKKRKGLKKLGQKMKKAFVEPFEKMGSRSGSRPGSRHASPHKRA